MTTSIALLFLPLAAGVLLNGIVGAKFPRRLAGWIGCLAIGASFVGALLAFQSVRSGFTGDVSIYSWIVAGRFQADIAFKFDALSAIMLLIVTGVSLLIHIYAVGYMNHEDKRGFSRFFAYLNLFVFAMLLLVLGNNYLLMFVGWEGVGLCSYLLIGFWYERERKPEDSTYPSQAAKKAFVVNRIGDFGFLLAMFLLVANFGTLTFDAIFKNAEAVGGGTLGLITLLLLLGAVGKSAQIPLYVWLPDAMQGPTPVSALIHAATMVTAGVYMIARSHVLYALGGTGELVAWIGAATALFAATMALASFDFKGVLAYSTISQLGYMFIGVGLGAYSAGIAHLMTHAFFKGLLFLTAGSVLHALHDVGDIRRMGGLISKMPVTFWTFVIAALALSGFPFSSGFFSKDAILLAAYQQNMPIFIVGFLTAGLTALYAFRLLMIAFSGETRDPQLSFGAHESPRVMTIPLVLLAIPAGLAGIFWLGMNEGGSFYRFLNPVFGEVSEHGGGTLIPMILTSAIVLIGIGAGILMYRGRTLESFARENWVVTLVRRKYFVDEAYDLLIVRPLRWASVNVLWRLIDNWLIDGVVNVAAATMYTGGALLRNIQTGIVQTYAAIILAGAVILLLAKLL